MAPQYIPGACASLLSYLPSPPILSWTYSRQRWNWTCQVTSRLPNPIVKSDPSLTYFTEIQQNWTLLSIIKYFLLLLDGQTPRSLELPPTSGAMPHQSPLLGLSRSLFLFVSLLLSAGAAGDSDIFLNCKPSVHLPACLTSHGLITSNKITMWSKQVTSPSKPCLSIFPISVHDNVIFQAA